MKAVNTQGSYPGFSDGLVIYQGQTPNNENKSVRQYRIETDIRTSLYVSLDAVNMNTNARFQIGFVATTSSMGTKIITFQVPIWSSVYYFISGSTFKQVEVSPELIDEGQQSSWTHGYYLHNHDGFSGVQLTLANNIQPDNIPFQAGKKVVVNTAGDRFVYVDASQGSNPPVFTLPALNSPADAIEIDPTGGDSTTYSWDTATNMTGSDIYTMVFNAVITPSNSFTVEVAGDITSSVQNNDIFDGKFGEVFVWNVVATNADGTGSTEERTIFTSA